MEILETLEERRPIIEPPAEEPATGEAFTETIAAESMVPPEGASRDVPSSKVDSPTIKVSSAKIVTTEVTSVPAATNCTGVTTVDTSAPPSNDRKDSAINFLYTIFFL